MAIHNPFPKNLGNIKRHLEKELSLAKKKLKSIDKSRFELTQKIETLKDGIEWCEKVYKISRG